MERSICSINGLQGIVFDFVCGIPLQSISVNYLEQFTTPPLIIFPCKYLSSAQDPDKVPNFKFKGVFLSSFFLSSVCSLSLVPVPF